MGGGGAVIAPGVLNADPQCIQNAAPGLTSPLQRGQVGEANCVFAIGVLLGCTGVPHSGQNFFPVTSLPQDVQVVIMLNPTFQDIFKQMNCSENNRT
jgi:hypothetical protein